MPEPTTTELASLAPAIIGNLVGDYLLQNSWMASQKKTSSFACAVHCAIWTAAVMFFANWPAYTAVPLFLSHFLLDRSNLVQWWMDIAGQKEFRTGPCAPWSTIVVDNVWHLVSLWVIWKGFAS